MLPDTWLFGLLILVLGTFFVFLVLLARILRRQPKRRATPPPPEVAPPVADDKALGADVILAAQARAVGAAVVTDNMRHIERMVPAVRWQDV